MTMPAEPLAPTPAPMGPPPPVSAPAPAVPPPGGPPPSGGVAPEPLIGTDATNELAPESLTAAYRSGALQFRADDRVPVRLASGKIGTVAAHEASDVVNGGGEIIPHAVVEHARLSKEYGGAGGTFGAGIAGAARGASLGVSDPIAIAAARLGGGDEGAAKMRERLNAYRELSPVASAVGEVAGMVAPALLTGGVSAEAEGVGALARGAGIAAAIPLEATSAIGRLGERGVAAILPDLGESLLGRATGKVLTKGAGAALEGAIFGAGQEISESSLGNENLTAEKLLASMGHGAVVAGLIGGGLGGAGEVASNALSGVRAKASPFLAHQAAEQMTKALNGDKKFSEEVERRFEGGAAGLGRTLLNLDVLPTKEAGLMGSGLAPQEILARVEPKLDEEGRRIGEMVDNSGGGVKLSVLRAQVENILTPLRSKAGFGPIVRAVEAYRDDLFEKLGATAEESRVASGKGAPNLIIPPHLSAQRPQIEELARAAAGGDAEAMKALDGLGVRRKTFRIDVAANETAAPRATKAIAIEGRHEPFVFDPNAGLEDFGEGGWRIDKHGNPVLHPGETESPIKIDMTRPGHIGDGPIIDPKMTEGADLGPGNVGIRKAYDVGMKPGALADESPAARKPFKIGLDVDATKASDKRALDNLEVPVSALFAQKKALAELVYKEAKALDPTQRVEQLRAIYGKLSDLELDAVDRAAAATEGPGRAELLAARKNYQALSLAKKALDKTTWAYKTNRNAGFGEYAAAGMAAASGHILAAPVVAIAHKVARARGNAFLAATYDRLSALQTLAKRSAGVDRDIDAGVKAFMGRAKGGEVKRDAIAKGWPGGKVPSWASIPGGESAREEFERRVTDLDGAQGEDHGAPVAALSAHAPAVAARFRDAAAMATQWLALQVPKAPPIGSQTPSAQEMHRFLLQARAVDNPAGTIASGLARGNLSPVETSAIRDCGAYPSLLAEIQQRIHIEAVKAAKSDAGGKLPYPVRRDMALLFDTPEWSMSAEGVKTLQDNTKPPAGGAGDGGGGSQGGPAPKRPMPSNSEQLMSGSERLAGGQIRET